MLAALDCSPLESPSSVPQSPDCPAPAPDCSPQSGQECPLYMGLEAPGAANQSFLKEKSQIPQDTLSRSWLTWEAFWR